MGSLGLTGVGVVGDAIERHTPWPAVRCVKHAQPILNRSPQDEGRIQGLLGLEFRLVCGGHRCRMSRNTNTNAPLRTLMQPDAKRLQAARAQNTSSTICRGGCLALCCSAAGPTWLHNAQQPVYISITACVQHRQMSCNNQTITGLPPWRPRREATPPLRARWPRWCR